MHHLSFEWEIMPYKSADGAVKQQLQKTIGTSCISISNNIIIFWFKIIVKKSVDFFSAQTLGSIASELHTGCTNFLLLLFSGRFFLLVLLYLVFMWLENKQLAIAAVLFCKQRMGSLHTKIQTWFLILKNTNRLSSQLFI